MTTPSARNHDRPITRFDVHVCRPEDSDVPATVLHSLFRAELDARLASRFGDAGRSIVLQRSDEEAAWFGVQLDAPVPAVAAAFCVDAAATASGVSVPGGHIRVFPGDVEIAVSEVNDVPCAAE